MNARPLVIVNPRAGRNRRGADRDRLRSAFARHGLEPVIVETEAAGHARLLARTAGGDPVVAVGGDGTVHEVISGLDLAIRRLGVIPAGCGNDFAWQHGIPRDLDAAVARIARGEERLVDVGECEAGRFANNLGLGFEAEVNRLSHRVRGVRGPARYFVALTWALATLRTYQVDLAWQSGAYTGRALTVALLNGRRVGGAFMLAPVASTGDGLLDLVVAGALNRRDVFRVLGPVLRGREPDDPRIKRATTAWLSVKAPTPVPVYLDGEYRGEHDKLDVRIARGALRLV